MYRCSSWPWCLCMFPLALLYRYWPATLTESLRLRHARDISALLRLVVFRLVADAQNPARDCDYRSVVILRADGWRPVQAVCSCIEPASWARLLLRVIALRACMTRAYVMMEG